MILKKHKAVIASLLSAAMAASAVAPTVVSAAGIREKDEKYGDETYVQRFLSLYDDVVTNGVDNGYLSENNKGKTADSFGVPYHSVEELVIEAPDYGHETTSEAMSYIVWMAAMRDNISQNGSVTLPNGKTMDVDKTTDLTKAWSTMEVMIPDIQTGMMTQTSPSATYSPEWEDPELYNADGASMVQNANGKNPIHSQFCQQYGGEKGLYLMHWLADVDDWYGYGGSRDSGSYNGGKFTFINTFQRGSEESCWETVPHPSIELKKYGNTTAGIKGIFKDEAENANLASQWAYTNAPDAEDRAIQAVYFANRYGVGDSSINVKAGMMGDELRNNFFDKYYRSIEGKRVDTDNMTADLYNQIGGNDMTGAHYLRSWYTSWGGAEDGSWTWQIGASHCHEFYQNPLAAYGLLTDTSLTSNMKTGQTAVKDYQETLKRQLEYYLWLQSDEGPIAGGSSSSWQGRYLTPKYTAEQAEHFGAATPTTFYGMSYVEHPVYADPGSNHWIGNQVWAVQRLAELYYVVTNEESVPANVANVTVGGKSIKEALKIILDKWVGWFLSDGTIKLEEDGSFQIPANLDWSGQPASWDGTYKEGANSDLHATIRNWGSSKDPSGSSSDLGCVASLSNTLIYYAAANGVDPSAAAKADNADLGGKALYTAHELLCRMWDTARDDIGLALPESNGSMYRLFTQEVFIPTYYHGKMPNGDALENGVRFIDFRSQYHENKVVQQYEEIFNEELGGRSLDSLSDDELNELEGTLSTRFDNEVSQSIHRFWHAGDILIALGTMYELYPTVDPAVRADEIIEGPTDPTDKPDPTDDTDPTGDDPTGVVAPTDDDLLKNALWGDVNVDGQVAISDLVLLNNYLLEVEEAVKEVTPQGLVNANVEYNDTVDQTDSTYLLNYLSNQIAKEKLGPQ
ncbi:MAG: dockerin type I domain-containing protein [Clostridium sp.]|nr:dockerin type I domain-containing protein [Clostridium sp.]MCM1547285.1 dockerin type I domain-containing protein [Ruminococcus sp.]